MSDVFISYSRKDLSFARLLNQALQDQQISVWIDWQDIPPSADWLAEVYEAIEHADSFVFIVSDTSVASDICGLEIEHAFAHNKRLIPIVLGNVDLERIPKKIAAINWIFFQDAGAAFAESLEQLLHAIRVDQVWLKAHTRLENRALDWQRKQDNPSLLLRGSELSEAESWLAEAGGKEPQPTALQTRYLLAGRAETTRRQRLTLGAVLAGLLLSLALGIFAWTQRNSALRESQARATAQAEAVHERTIAEAASTQAVEQRNEAQTQTRLARAGLYSVEALAHLDDDLSLALLLSIEAINQAPTVQSRSSLLSAINHNPALVQTFFAHKGATSNLVFSSLDGSLISAGCSEPGPSAGIQTCQQSELAFWDPASRRLLERVTTAHAGFISQLALSPDGRLLASSDWTGTIILWDLLSRLPLGEPLTGRSGRVLDLVFTPDSQRLISSHEILTDNLLSGELKVWDTQRVEEIVELAAPLSAAYGNLLISADGKWLIAALLSAANISLWDLDSWERLPEAFEGYEQVVQSLALSPDGKRLLLGNYDGSIMVWDFEKQALLPLRLEAHAGTVDSLAYSPEGSQFASTSPDQTLRLWDADRFEQIGDPFAAWDSPIQDLAYSSDGKMIATANTDGSISLWEPGSRSILAHALEGHRQAVWSVAITGTGGVIASGSADQTVRIWDLGNPTGSSRSLAVGVGQVYTLAFSPDDAILAVGGQMGVEFWNWQLGRQLLSETAPHHAPVVSLAFSPDGSLLASGGMDSQIVLWDTASRMVLGTPLEGHQATINALAFSPSGALLASAGCAHPDSLYCREGELILWDLNPPAVRARISAHTHYIWALAFSPDGRTIATGSGDETLQLWDVETASARGEPLLGNDNGVSSLAFSPDGRLLVSGGFDHQIMLTDLASRQRIGPLLAAHQGAVSSLVFSTDGELLISGGHDSRIFVWPMQTAAWISQACLRAGRNLSQAEWDRYFPGEMYRQTCSQWP